MNRGQYGKAGTSIATRVNETAACENCTVGRYSSAMGVTDATGCNACPPGKHSNVAGVTGINDA